MNNNSLWVILGVIGIVLLTLILVGVVDV